MLTKGQEYTNQGQDYYEERYRERVPPRASFIRVRSNQAASMTACSLSSPHLALYSPHRA